MLIGKQTQLNNTLEEVLSMLVPRVRRLTPEEFLDSNVPGGVTDSIVFVNLTDLTDEETAILQKLKESNSPAKIVGIHTFMVPAMKKEVLDRGYDAYISFFEFSEQVEELLQSFGIKTL